MHKQQHYIFLHYRNQYFLNLKFKNSGLRTPNIVLVVSKSIECETSALVLRYHTIKEVMILHFFNAAKISKLVVKVSTFSN